MTHLEWQKLLTLHGTEIYNTLVKGCDCGPWDGGCIVIAEAIRAVIGGDVCVLTRADDTADHAVVFKDGMLYDYSGPRQPKRFIETFNKVEHRDGTFAATGYRAIREGDLPDTSRDQALILSLAGLYTKMLPETMHAQPTDTHEVSRPRYG